YCCGFYCCFEFFKIDQTIWFNREISYFATALFNVLASIENSFMFSSNSNDMVALAGIHFKNTFDRKVVALCCARSEDDLFRIGADQFRYLFACVINCFFSLPTKWVITACRITKMF